MLLENYIRLLLEAPQIKLGDLMKHPGKVLVGKNYQSYWEFANVEFKSFHANEDLSKRGPFFNCMKLCFDEFLSYENDPEFDVAENLLAMIVYINGLYDFKNNHEVNKVYTTFISDSYNGFKELREAYENIFHHIGPKNLNSFNNPNYINMLKTSQTEYVFDTPDRTMNGLLAVVPTTTASSIFWSRTNASAQQILLKKLGPNNRQDREYLSWCTSLPEDSNLFHTYYVNGGTSLFYFLPIDDVKGLNKFCIGITKIRDEDSDDDFKLICGGHTTVGFENQVFIEERSDFTDDAVKQMMLKKFGPLGLTMNILNIIQEKVSGRNPFDKYAYTGNLKPAEFAALINMNTIGSTEDGRKTIKREIENILSIYEDPEFLRNYQPNPKILQIINKDLRYWTECDVDVKYIPEKLGGDLEFWKKSIINNAHKIDAVGTFNYLINFVDWNFKKRPNLITADFIINFIEECLNTTVQEGKYNGDMPEIRENRFNQTDYMRDDETYEYGLAYDQIILNFNFNVIPIQALMMWSNTDIIKFFKYVNNIKSNYPEKVISNSTNKNISNIYQLFFRKLGFNCFDERNAVYTNREFLEIKLFSQKLLKILFTDLNDFESYCLKQKESNIYYKNTEIPDFFIFDNSDENYYSPILLPSEWCTPEIINERVISNFDKARNTHYNFKIIFDILTNKKNRNIKINNFQLFIENNQEVLKIIIPAFLNDMAQEILKHYERSGNINLILQSHTMKIMEDILKNYDSIIKSIEQTELADINSEYSKFISRYNKIFELKNRRLNVADDFNNFITTSAMNYRDLVKNESKEIGDFVIRFINILKSRLTENDNLSNFKNSFFMANECFKYNAEILNLGQNYFWNFDFESYDTVIKDPNDWAHFFYQIYEGNMSFSLVNINSNYDFKADVFNKLMKIKTDSNAISDFENKIINISNLENFINCNAFKGIMQNFDNFVSDDEGEEFFTKIMQKLYNDYFNLDSNRFTKFCLVFFKDNPYNSQNKYLNILTQKFLKQTSDDKASIEFKNFDQKKGIDETLKYRDEKRRVFNEKRKAEILAQRDQRKLEREKLSSQQDINNDDDSIDESFKFKIGQKILTESQLKYLIRHLL
jgi:hypothetical protein